MITNASEKVTTTATGVAATVLSALLLAGCSQSGGAEGADACSAMEEYQVDPGAQSVVAVLDPTASMRNGSWLSPSFDALVTQAAGVYSTLSVLWVGGSGETPTWAVDALPLNSEAYEFDTLHYNQAVERASGCVQAMIGAPATAQPGSDLGTAIQVAADRLAASTGPRMLVVVSDGLANTGPIDLTGAVATTAVGTVVSELDAEGYRPDLAGVDVTFTGIGVTSDSVTDGPTVTWLRNYYTAVCRRAGAATCDAPVTDQGATADGTGPRADAPEDPDLALPSVQFEFSGSEVRFEPDSTALTPEADVALSKVAACLRDGSTLTVIGHSASTGDPAGEQDVSDGRAKNAASRILEIAGRPDVTVEAFGVGSTEPKSASGSEPEDRRVDISVTGVCN